MRITDISYERLRFKLHKPFVIAIGVIEYAETILIKVSTDEGITGLGEATPFAPVTGETLDSVIACLEIFKKALIGINPLEIEKIHKVMNRIMVYNSAAKAGIDIAMYDILGKKLEMPLYKVLGGFRDSFLTDMTVSIGEIDTMAADAARFVQDGFKILKVKAGVGFAEDMAVIKAIREAVGSSVRLRVDANQGWDTATAIKVMQGYEQFGVEAVEQPVMHWDIDGLAYVRQHTRIPVIADESLHSPQDAMKLAKAEAVDMFNIKLMKSGGIYPALAINAIGESCGIRCMLGCMVETRLSITAAASLVAAKKNITEADLDSFSYFSDDTITGGFTIENGAIKLSDKPGLGIVI